MALQIDPLAPGDGRLSDFAVRYDEWRRAAEHPGLVLDVFLVQLVTDGEPVLSRWVPARRAFERAEWTKPLLPVRTRAGEFGRDPSASERPRSSRLNLIVGEVPALLTPILSAERLRERWPGARPAVLWGFSALVLDLDYVRQRLLPELATRHFGAMRSNRPNTVDNQI